MRGIAVGTLWILLSLTGANRCPHAPICERDARGTYYADEKTCREALKAAHNAGDVDKVACFPAIDDPEHPVEIK